MRVANNVPWPRLKADPWHRSSSSRPRFLNHRPTGTEWRHTNDLWSAQQSRKRKEKEKPLGWTVVGVIATRRNGHLLSTMTRPRFLFGFSFACCALTRTNGQQSSFLRILFYSARKPENEAADMEASRRPNNPAAGS